MARRSALPLVVRLLPALDYGGVESRVVLQSEFYDRTKYQLRVCALHGDGAAAARIRRSGVPVDVLGCNPAVRHAGCSFAVARYLRALRPHVLHASIAEANWHGWVASRFAAVPSLIVEEVGIPRHGLLGRLAFAAVYRTANVALAVSAAARDAMVANDGSPPSRIRVVHNCGNPRFFPEERVSPRRRPSASLRILAVGRLVPVKNHATLIRALAMLVQEGIEARLTLLGEGPLRPDLEQLAVSLGVETRVRFRGFVDDVIHELLEHDCFVLPSHSEGCSISLIEAMASALPPLTSRAEGNLELTDGFERDWSLEATSVQSWKAAMARFAALPTEVREKLGASAQEIAYSRFSPAKYLSVLEQLYRDANGLDAVD